MPPTACLRGPRVQQGIRFTCWAGLCGNFIPQSRFANNRGHPLPGGKSRSLLRQAPVIQNECEMTDKDQIKLKYRWVKTWPDAIDDFSSIDGRETIGRIYKYQNGPQKDRWFWTMTVLSEDRISVACDGIEPSAREAGKRVEDAYQTISLSQF